MATNPIQVYSPEIVDAASCRVLFEEFVVMPNHVHVLVAPLGEHRLSEILHSWKSFTANAINKRLGRKGAFWQKESFDHIVRDVEHKERIRAYIRENPGETRLDAASTLRASAELGRKVAALLDTETPVLGVTTGKIRDDLKMVAVFTRMDGKQVNPDAGDLEVTAGWGHAGKAGVIMPGRGNF